MLRDLGDEPLRDFVEADAKAIVKLYTLYGRLHGLDTGVTDEQLRAISFRTESYLSYLLRVREWSDGVVCQLPPTQDNASDLGMYRDYAPHPSYKDSGVGWLADIPTHWQMRRLKYLATVNDEVLAETVDPNREVAYVDIWERRFC